MSLLGFFTSKLWGTAQAKDTQKFSAKVLNSIFSYLNKANLQQCCLVSHYFCSIARQHLFSQITLKSARDCAAFYDLLHKTPERSTFVRSLEIVTEGNDQLPENDWGSLYSEKLVYILDKASDSLFEFRYQAGSQGQSFNDLPEDLRIALTKLVKSAPRLSTISITSLSFPIQLFGLSPQLTRLRLHNVDVVEGPGANDERGPAGKSDHITALEVDSCTDATLQVLLDAFSLSNMHELSLQGTSYDRKYVFDFIERSKSSLQKLTWGAIRGREDLFAFGEMPWIESLTLGPFMSKENLKEDWEDFISGFRKGPDVHGLQELTLVEFRSTPGTFRTMLHEDPLWELLDEVMTLPKFGELQRVTLSIPVSMEEWMDYGNPSVVVLTKMLKLLNSDRVKVRMGGQVYP